MHLFYGGHRKPCSSDTSPSADVDELETRYSSLSPEQKRSHDTNIVGSDAQTDVPVEGRLLHSAPEHRDLRPDRCRETSASRNHPPAQSTADNIDLAKELAKRALPPSRSINELLRLSKSADRDFSEGKATKSSRANLG